MAASIKSTEKSEAIALKLVSEGIPLEIATRLSHEVLGLAYQKTKSTQRRSLEEYKLEFGETKKWEVFDFICKHPSLTRQEIANAMGYRRSTICGRVRELLDLGAIVVNGGTTDLQTGKRVQTLSFRVEMETY